MEMGANRLCRHTGLALLVIPSVRNTHSYVTRPPNQLSIAIYRDLPYLVATYSVRNPVWSVVGSVTRARPKSQIYNYYYLNYI